MCFSPKKVKCVSVLNQDGPVRVALPYLEKVQINYIQQIPSPWVYISE